MTIRKVAIITGASQGIGAGLAAGYRGRDWAVVASARTIKPSEDPDLLAVAGDSRLVQGGSVANLPV
jgi:NAD(P)-dependent dehydrogenase (short-subunit alcohol dehydrogenase family)